MASGFTEDSRFDLAVTYGRIAFPYILFISLAALLSGVLNATGRFMAAAAAPVLLNVIFIAAMMIADLMGGDIGLAMTWTVPIAGIAQVVLVWIAASRAGYRLIPRMPQMTPELKRLAIIAAPAALAGGVTQINLLVGRQVASFFEGAVAWLYYADRLYQLPLGRGRHRHRHRVAAGTLAQPARRRYGRQPRCTQPRGRDVAGPDCPRRGRPDGDPDPADRSAFPTWRVYNR